MTCILGARWWHTDGLRTTVQVDGYERLPALSLVLSAATERDELAQAGSRCWPGAGRYWWPPTTFEYIVRRSWILLPLSAVWSRPHV
jgi:hypothetical protein